MKYEIGPSFESPSVTVPPAVESLVGNTTKTYWPETVLQDKTRIEQSELRREVSTNLESFFERVPNVETSVEDALSKKQITEEELTHLYDSLSNLLEQDPLHRRVLLYIPFELLPTPHMATESSELAQSIEHFVAIYKKKWHLLLGEHDLRADFNDGDVPEAVHRTEQLPEVIKAAHLTPWLVSRKILSVHEIMSIIARAKAPILRESFFDTFPTLRDLKLLSDADIDTLLQSEDPGIRNSGKIIHSYETEETSTQMYEEPAELIQAFISQYVHTQSLTPENSRQKWQQQTAGAETVAEYGRQLAHFLENEHLTPQDLARFTEGPEKEAVGLLVIEAIRHTLVEKGKRDPAAATHELERYTDLLFMLRKNAHETSIQNAIKTLYLHLRALEIIDSSTLKQLNIDEPNLDNVFENCSDELQQESAILQESIKNIERHPELSKLIFPVTIALGSRMRGYAGNDSDLDIAIFVRPGTSEDSRGRIQTLLQEIMPNGHAMEFWLEEKDGAYAIRDYENPDPERGDSSLSHPLLGAWYGNEPAIQELYEKLMPGYVDSNGKTILGEDARRVWLQDMEHTVLQYRLMHKGYRRFYPSRGGLSTRHRDEIDGSSTFYDSGFRRLATKLFVEKVFLPRLGHTKNQTGAQ